MIYINYKYWNCYKISKFDFLKYLKLGEELNKYVKIGEERGFIRKSIFRLFCVEKLFFSWFFEIKGLILL